MLDLSRLEFLYFVHRRTDHTFALERQPIPALDLTYLISGEMSYLYNDREITLHAGDAILFPPGSIRERKESYGPVRYASINIKFHEDYTLPATELHLLAGHLPGRTTVTAISILETLSGVWRSDIDCGGMRCLSLFSFLYYQLLYSDSDNQNPYVRHIKHYISEHITEKLTLQEISADVRLAPEYCCSLFKKHTGGTLFSYILEQRVDMAKRLIMLGDVSLKDIATEVGFTDYNYFSRAFKQCTGLTPSTYRKLSDQGR